MVGRGRREGGAGWGTRVYPWWIHVDVWQNQYNTVKLQHTHTHTHKYEKNLARKKKKKEIKKMQKQSFSKNKLTLENIRVIRHCK